MRLNFQILQNYAKESVPTLVLNIHSRRYFFNIPETFHRLHPAHGIKLTKSAKIFITQMSTDHIGGLIGLLLSVTQDKLAEGVQLYGPPGLSSYLYYARSSIGYRILPFSSYDFFNFDQKLLGVNSQAITKDVVGKLASSRLQYNQLTKYLQKIQREHPNYINDAQEFIRNSEYYKDEHMEIHPLFILPNEYSENVKACLSYICKPNKKLGRVNVEKLETLGVPKRLISQILSEKEVEVKGVVYRAKDFQEPAEPVPILIILNCPDSRYIDSLVTQEGLESYYEDRIDRNEMSLTLMVHMAPMEVLLDKRYQEFLQRFDSKCQHIFVNENLTDKENNERGELKEEEIEEITEKERLMWNLRASFRGKILERPGYPHFMETNLFAKYFPNHFPKLKHIKAKGDYEIDNILPSLSNKVIAKHMTEYTLAPLKEQGFYPVTPNIKLGLVLSTFRAASFNDVYQNGLNEIKKLMQKPSTGSEFILPMFKDFDPELVFLGTGSMRATSYRNVSGIYLRFWQQGDIGILLDCGEGTYFQLLHHYGPEKTRELLKNLSVIYITHIHADHHLGVMKMLIEREKILKEENIQKDPVFLIVPQGLVYLLNKYGLFEKVPYRLIINNEILKKVSDLDKFEDNNEPVGRKQIFKKASLGGEFEFNEEPDHMKFFVAGKNESSRNIPLLEKFLEEQVGITGFHTAPVNHSVPAHAVLIQHKSGWKFAYSGDTMPSARMIKDFGFVTVLVHEATMENDMEEMAEQKKHSTERQAVEVGIAMNAWRTLLTHFSARIMKVEHDKKKIGSVSRGSKIKKEKGGIIVNEEDFTVYNNENTVRVYDHLTCKLSELDYMPVVSRILASMYPQDDE